MDAIDEIMLSYQLPSPSIQLLFDLQNLYIIVNIVSTNGVAQMHFDAEIGH